MIIICITEKIIGKIFIDKKYIIYFLINLLKKSKRKFFATKS